jgi:hypothetical protein
MPCSDNITDYRIFNLKFSITLFPQFNASTLITTQNLLPLMVSSRAAFPLGVVEVLVQLKPCLISNC